MARRKVSLVLRNFTLIIALLGINKDFIASAKPFLTFNIEANPPITMAPTPIYLIFVDQSVEAPCNGSSANSSPLPSNGIPTSHPKNPPIKIRTAIFNLTIKPTANNAGEISPPKKKILFPTKTAPSKTL